MTAAFKVGDVATGQAFVYNTEYNGMDCEIIAPLASYWAKHPAGHTRVAQFYRVRWPDGSVNLVRPIHLRPKKPPRREIDTVVSWADCRWQPVKAPTC